MCHLLCVRFLGVFKPILANPVSSGLSTWSHMILLRVTCSADTVQYLSEDVELISSYGVDPKNRYFYTMVLDSVAWPHQRGAKIPSWYGSNRGGQLTRQCPKVLMCDFKARHSSKSLVTNSHNPFLWPEALAAFPKDTICPAGSIRTLIESAEHPANR